MIRRIFDTLAIVLFVALWPALSLAQVTKITPASGGSSGITIDSTAISGGATTQVLYNAAGVVSSDSGFTRGSGTTGISNGVAAVSPLIVYDNETPVFTIADGGTTTVTQPILHAVGSLTNASMAWTGSVNSGFYSAGSGTTINTLSGVAITAIATDANFGNAASLRLKSSAGLLWASGGPEATSSDLQLGREGATILQLGLDVNGAAVAQTLKAHDGITGTDIAGANLILAGGRGTGTGAGGNVRLQTSPALTTGTTAQTLEDRLLVIGKQFNLTDNTIATFGVMTLGNDTGGGGSIGYCVYAGDATTAAVECGDVDFAGVDVTAGAGGEVCPTPTKHGTPLQALSGATLTVTFAASTGTDLCNIRVTADPNIATPTSLYIKYTVNNSGGRAWTAQ